MESNDAGFYLPVWRWAYYDKNLKMCLCTAAHLSSEEAEKRFGKDLIGRIQESYKLRKLE